MKLTFLGTGTSFGVPQLGCGCAVCNSSDPRDRRTRVGAVVETDAGATILIDTPPELRLQLLREQVARVDAVLFTHDHADHIAGIDDVRAITTRLRTHMPMFGSRETLDALRRRYAYIFDDSYQVAADTSKPQARLTEVEPFVPFVAAGAEVTALPVPHGALTVFGYRIGPIAYITDAKSIPPAVVDQLRGVEVLVLNALFHRPHSSHLSFSEAVAVAREIGARQTWLTHLSHENSHAALAAELPPSIQPAWDGLAVTI